MMSKEPVIPNVDAVVEGLLDLSDEDFECEYKEDIWKNLLKQDAEKPVIHLQSPQLEFRGTLVQHLRDLTRKLSLSISTLHAAVAQLDLFMDAHRLRADRLTHVAMACFSLAAKSEEKHGRAPTLKVLAKTSGTQLCGKTFRQLEWMVGQHLRWRLLAPTPVTFAAHLAKHVVTAGDISARHPKIVRKLKRDGAKLLEAYLDLTLSDVRLKVVECVDVGCACVACARADLGLGAWPPSLVALSGRKPDSVVPIARLLHRMMLILKSRENGVKRNLSPPHVAPQPSLSSTSGTTLFDVDVSYQQLHERTDALEDTNLNLPPNQDYYRIPPADLACQRVNTTADYGFFRSSRLLEASLGGVQPTTSMAVKRVLESSVELERKRYRLASQYRRLYYDPSPKL